MPPEHCAIAIDANGHGVHGFATAVKVANFLGIPFGRIDKRFCVAKSLLISDIGPSFDATQWGPRCPQSRNHGRESRGHLYESHPAANVRESELDCLNLNVFVPEDLIGSARKVPVMVWVHGGGWVFGDGGPDYDGNNLVARAVSLENPFILVTINYRLGYYGFLSSRELQHEADAEGEQYTPNVGLHDQRLALEWVQKHIGHFGGDRNRITIAGQSAGAWSALGHLLADQPLCHRGIIMSATVIEFETDSERQATFDDLVRRAGVPSTASPAEKVRALRDICDKDMTDWLDGAVLVRPAWDASWFPNCKPGTRLDQMNSLPSWVEGLIIGSTRNETAAIGPAWQLHSAATIRQIIASAMSDQSLTDEILQVYGIDSDVPEDAVRGVVELTTESFFGLFPYVVGDMHPSVRVYRFDQADSFDESHTKGLAYHCLDLPFLIRTSKVAGMDADPQHRATSDALTSAVADLVCANPLWEPYSASQTIMIFDGKDSGPRQMFEARWKQFFDTPGRAKALVDLGRALMTYRSGRLPKVQ